jgi:isopenicillin-N epimerase
LAPVIPAPPERAVLVEGVEVSWDRRRELFSLDPRVAHLNHGSYGAVPIPVQRAQQRLRDEVDANPMAFFTRGLLDRLTHTRRHLAAFVGADPDGVALVTNATAAAQVVLGSLRLGPDDEVLLTDHGYGAVRLAAERCQARTGVAIHEVAIPLTADDDEVVALIRAAATPGRTRLAVVDHITSATAKVFPVDRIVAALRDQGVPVLVDAAHAPGMVPVDVSRLGAAYWLGNLHKWGFAPRATALLAVDAAHRATIEPLIVSWSQPSGYPASVEFGGTLDYTAWLAAPTALHLMRTLGIDRVQHHNANLAAYGQRSIASALARLGHQAPLIGDDSVSMRVVWLPPGVAPDRSAAADMRLRLAAEHGIEVVVDSWQGHGFLRLSAQLYNRPEEYDLLADLLMPLLRAA